MELWSTELTLCAANGIQTETSIRSFEKIQRKIISEKNLTCRLYQICKLSLKTN